MTEASSRSSGSPLGGRRGLRDQVVGGAAYDGLVEGVLVAEVVVEQAAGDAGLLGQQVDRQLVERPGGQQADAEVEQLRAALVRASAGCVVWLRHGPHSIDTCSITPVPSAAMELPTAASSTSSSAPGSPASAPRSSSRRTARRDFLVVEKGSDVGGTWRDNTYPGAACDVPSQLYSFSFAPNPEWSQLLLPAAGDPGLHPAGRRAVRDARPVRVRHPSIDATWDDAAAALDGADRRPDGERTVASTTLIVGAGGLSEPRLPEIEGIETFQGELFHSARWDHDVDLAGKRVAVIGTGASAIQIVPEMQQVRRPPRRLPAHRAVGDPPQRPDVRRASSGACCAGCRRCAGSTGPASTGPTRATCPAFTLAAEARAARQEGRRRRTSPRGIKDPELRAKVTPHFELGCKRVLRSNTYYPALAADNAELVTDPIAKVTGDAIVTADGVERPIDVLVVATGFYTTELPDRRAHHRPRRRDPGRQVARRAGWRRTRARPSPASPTCS